MDIFDGLTALGGLCLFLFGMQIMAEALQRRAGGRLEGLLRRMTRSRWAGFFTGLAVTAAVQSSSAAMVMVVGFVNSGMLTLRQAVGVIMGTNVGTTVTPWLLSLGGLEGGGVLERLLRPAGFVPLLSLWGIAAYLAGKGSRRDTGQALLGFAVLMQGMEIMTAAVSGLARAEGFRQLFTAFGSPLLGVLAGAIQGYYGGKIDLWGQRFIEVWSGMPTLFLIILLSSVVQPGFWWLLAITVLFGWMTLVGVVRAEFLRTRNYDYIRAAQALGVSDRQIILRHMLPNAMVATLTFLPFILCSSITTLTSLDFLGFGLPLGSPSLGELLLQGKNNLQAPWLGIASFLSVAVLLTLLIFIGEAVRDAFDPSKAV